MHASWHERLAAVEQQLADQLRVVTEASSRKKVRGGAALPGPAALGMSQGSTPGRCGCVRKALHRDPAG